MKNYVAVLLDPPWPESGGGKIKRGADRHYGLIKTKHQIRDVIVGSGVWTPADNAHMYLWTTNNYLGWAMWLIEELGFVYKTNFPWVKPGRPGIGQYARGQHELLLFATRGKGFAVKTDSRAIGTGALVGVPRVTDALTGKTIHSAKPPQVYDLIDDRTVAGPRLELFARTRHSDAWDVWGNEAPQPIASQDDE